MRLLDYQADPEAARQVINQLGRGADRR